VKLAEALNHSRAMLAQNAIVDAALEAELLLRHTLKIDRTQLYLDLKRELSLQDERAYEALIKRRLGGEPAAYIIGHHEFYGLDFYVDSNTLIPRPESELLVETALRLAPDHHLTIADIGTGCGAIAISLALELPQAKIYAIDISSAALEVASRNCQRHSVADRVNLMQGDMLEPLPAPIDLIIANLPYVRQSELSHRNFEPLIALDGGAKGTESIEKLCRQAQHKIAHGGSMLLEIGQGQGKSITSLLSNLFPDGNIEVLADLGGIDRVVSLSLGRARVAG
jgi:release factor glutamine methyltransferase